MQEESDMKVIVVGSTHAGTAAIKQTLANYPDTDITVYEKNDNVSFLSCGIALYLQGEVKDVNGLFYSSPEELASLGADLKMGHEVLKIDAENKSVQVRDLATGAEFTDTYDKLVMTTGSLPIVPPIDGIQNDNIYLCKNYHDAQTLFAKADDVESVIVIGAGYIGVELVEAFEKRGKKVTVIDGMPRIMNKYFDEPFTDKAAAMFEKHGIKVVTGEMVKGFSGDKQVTVKTDGGEYTADIAILSIGFKPNTTLLKGQVDMLPNGAIMTNNYMQTSNPDIFGAGDSVAVHYNPTHDNAYIPLATNAVRQGTLVGMNIVKPTLEYMGTQASSGLKLYDLNFAASGLTKEAAEMQGMDVQSVTVEDNFRPEFMSSTTPVLMTLVWEAKTHRIVGAQFVSEYDISQSANAVSIAIQAEFKIEQLAMVDMLFQPWFDRPFNYLNSLGQAAVAQAAQA